MVSRHKVQGGAYFTAAAVEVVAADEEVDVGVTSRRSMGSIVLWASGTSMLLRRRLSDGWARVVAARRAEKRIVMVE